MMYYFGVITLFIVIYVLLGFAGIAWSPLQGRYVTMRPFTLASISALLLVFWIGVVTAIIESYPYILSSLN